METLRLDAVEEVKAWRIRVWEHGRNMSAGVSSSGSNSGSGSGCGSDSSSGSNDIFSYFGRQQQAFEYYDMLSFNNEHEQQQQQMQQPVIKGLKLYSFERDSDGQRKFLVSTWSRFLHEYLSYTNNHGHFYEIIREHTPCRLYFDLEYPICVSSGREHMVTNEDVDGDAIVAKFINLVVWKLHELLGICLDDENVIVLDSSSERKFSKHIIISMHSNAADCALWNAAVTRSFDSAEECLFQDNVEINKLIDHIFDEIYKPPRAPSVSSSGSDLENDSIRYSDERVMQAHPHYSDFFMSKQPEQSQMLSNKDTDTDHNNNVMIERAVNKERMCFIDRGVYTRNRAFRIFGSTKYGKNEGLRLVKSDKSVYKGLNRYMDSVLDKQAHRTKGEGNSRRQLYNNALLRSFVVPVCEDINNCAQSPTLIQVPPHSSLSSVLHGSGDQPTASGGASVRVQHHHNSSAGYIFGIRFAFHRFHVSGTRQLCCKL
jgi:hypothetical protein